MDGCNFDITIKSEDGMIGSGGRLSPGVRPCSLAARFWPPLATVVSTEPFSHGTGTLQKEVVTYRHWSVSLWWDPDDLPHCWILSSDKTDWWFISATLCGWKRCFVAEQLGLWHAHEKKKNKIAGRATCHVSHCSLVLEDEAAINVWLMSGAVVCSGFHTTKDHVYSLALTVYDSFCSLSCWNLLLGVFQNTSKQTAVAWSTDYSYLAVGNDDGFVLLHNLILVATCVHIDDVREGFWLKLLPCSWQSPTLHLGHPGPWIGTVHDVKSRAVKLTRNKRVNALKK